MSEPLIFIGTHALKPGKLEDFARQSRELAEVVEANEPRMIAFNIYADGGGTEVAVVQVHPDADSMMLHMQVVREHITQAYAESLEATKSIQVFGPSTEQVLEMIKQLSSPGVDVTVAPNHLAGFTRAGG